MAKTTAHLLADAKARGAMPTTNGLLTSVEILELADEEMRTEIASLLIEARSEYWVTSVDRTIVSGTASYRVPDRAIGNGLRDVILRDTAGNEFDLVQRPATERHLYSAGDQRSRAPFAFAFENGKVVLLPTPTAAHAGWTLRLRYYARPPSLIETSAAAMIISATSSSIVVIAEASNPTTITTTGALVDIVRGDGMHEAMYPDLAVLLFDGGPLSFTTSVIDTAEIADSSVTNGRRDYVCPTGQSVYPPIPELVYPVLVAATQRAVMEVRRDAEALAIATAMLKRKRSAALLQMVPRADGAVMRAVRRWSPLRGG